MNNKYRYNNQSRVLLPRQALQLHVKLIFSVFQNHSAGKEHKVISILASSFKLNRILGGNLPAWEFVISSQAERYDDYLEECVDWGSNVGFPQRPLLPYMASLNCVNPLRAKFFRGNINIYLHCVSFLHIDTTQEVEILPEIRQEPTYFT